MLKHTLLIRGNIDESNKNGCVCSKKNSERSNLHQLDNSKWKCESQLELALCSASNGTPIVVSDRKTRWLISQGKWKASCFVSCVLQEGPLRGQPSANKLGKVPRITDKQKWKWQGPIIHPPMEKWIPKARKVRVRPYWHTHTQPTMD